MASDSAFQMNYGHVDGKARCAVIRGTILKSRLMGDLFIGCTEHGSLEKAFKKLAPKGAEFDNSIAQDMVVFRSDTVALGDQARAAVPPSRGYFASLKKSWHSASNTGGPLDGWRSLHRGSPPNFSWLVFLEWQQL